MTERKRILIRLIFLAEYIIVMTIELLRSDILNEKLAKGKGASPLYSQIADDLRFCNLFAILVCDILAP